MATCVLPVAVAALLLVYRQYLQEWQQAGRQTGLEARLRVAALDREFAGLIAGMKVLSTAPELATDDLAGWHRRASAAAPTQNVDNFLLTDREGRQRANTLRPPGSPLPTTGTPVQLAGVFSTGQPVITDLFIGPVTKQPVMAIGVPVVAAGAVRYSLNIGVAPRRFQQLLEAHELPPGWIAAILDGQGRIVARSRDPERWLGQPTSPDVMAQIVDGTEGSTETVTLDGMRVVSSLSRSTLSGWSLVVGAPRAELERQVLGWAAAAAAGVLGAALTGLWVALRIARRVTGAVDGLNSAARAMAQGHPVQLPALRLREAEAVGQALLEASENLQRTRHAAQHDPLTGLSNRAMFHDQLHRQLAAAARRRSRFAVLLLDLDDFKRINDAQGHAAGDRALRAAARRILHTVRAADTAARLGGDEFVVLLDEADEAHALAAATRLLSTLATADEAYAEPLGASIGVALWPDAGQDADALLHAADDALYAAKRGGKGRVRLAPADNPGPTP